MGVIAYQADTKTVMAVTLITSSSEHFHHEAAIRQTRSAGPRKGPADLTFTTPTPLLATSHQATWLATRNNEFVAVLLR